MSEAQNVNLDYPTHRLLDDSLGGDGLEKPLWSLLGEKFPKYEVFWSEFIWPLTNRVYSDRHGPKDLHFRPEVADRCSDLHWLAQAHYVAFRRYGSLYLRVHHWPFGKGNAADSNALLKSLLHQDRFADVYALFIGVDDMISTVASTLLRLRAEAGIEPLPPALGDAEVREAFENWLASDRYQKAVEGNRRTGFPIMFYLTHRGMDLKQLLPKAVFTEHEKFRGRVARYRNLQHKPHPAQMWKAGEHLVPKPEKVADYQLWSRMAMADTTAIDTDFSNVEETMAKDVETLSTMLNNIWDVFIVKMKEVAATPKYSQWLAIVPEEADGVVYLDGLAHYAPATSSAWTPSLSLSGVRASTEKRPGRFGI